MEYTMLKKKKIYVTKHLFLPLPHHDWYSGLVFLLLFSLALLLVFSSYLCPPHILYLLTFSFFSINGVKRKPPFIQSAMLPSRAVRKKITSGSMKPSQSKPQSFR